MSIQVLSADVINQISAGEVVERPAHLVKELIENSIDAKASEVIVEFAQGGRSVRISDNGEGIRSEDLTKALQRHATSKISVSDDLWNLNTFGFRGEALASIAAVSKLTLQSFHVEEKKPSQIVSDFGKVSKVIPSSRSCGTEIKIENLFDNVPARLKFLKSESSETQQIKNVVKAMALAHPTVEFKLIQDGDLQLYYQRRSYLLERARDVLERNQLFSAVFKKGSFSADVVFSSPQDVVKTSKQIWIFAQNRFIQDRALQAAVMDSYRSLLMHGEYPLAVIKLHCDPQEIDVNIHPTKSQVKFQDASMAFRTVHGALREALEKAPWIVAPKESAAIPSVAVSPSLRPDYSVQVSQNLSFHDQSFQQTQFKKKDFSIESLSLLAVNNSQPTVGYWGSLQVLGQANLTYIVCQKKDHLVYVDQHAAHERVVFESLMRSWKQKSYDIQNYLFPFVIDLTEDKVESLLELQNQIAELGIEIERLGPMSLGVKSAPSLLKDGALPQLFEKMAVDVQDHGGSYAIEKKIGDLFATMACHSVVRAGQSLSLQQMQELLVSMDEFALSSFCPHGRPVSIEIPFTELEKQFGRIN
ncbi:MAG: DNA mismatch repair protein MutL [Bdellovibrionales bacterium RIFCSPHIGHO2_01_FULL_40_29]|nr:MAG: DNA mismatch repair protein MutL [Bdellovibrionales bacterium RIFCSPHIGHO2_01_FULL_40_29]OFZ34554.1 MAG: DNA mismatch repair protein MutL [Bdellovibrionales bacterium RIFCSPHIGHO2_02_FULL_40_15]